MRLPCHLLLREAYRLQETKLVSSLRVLRTAPRGQSVHLYDSMKAKTSTESMVSACTEECTCGWRSRCTCRGPWVWQRGCIGSCGCSAGGRWHSRRGCPGSRCAHAPKQGCEGVCLVRSRCCLLSSVHEWLLHQMRLLSMHSAHLPYSMHHHGLRGPTLRNKPQHLLYTRSARGVQACSSGILASLDTWVAECQEEVKVSDFLCRLSTEPLTYITKWGHSLTPEHSRTCAAVH